MPIVLIYESLETEWDYPATLTLLKTGEKELVYDLVAQVFYSGSHYTSRFAGYFDEYGPSSVFAHDGMTNDGHCVLLSPDGIASHLAGKDINLDGIARGYHTSAVFYRLRGGYESQKIFLKHQIDLIRTRFGVTFSPDHLDQLPMFSFPPSQFESFPDNLILGIWIPKMGHSEYRVIGMLDDEVDQLLLQTVGETLKRKRHKTPSLLTYSSDNNKPSPK